MNALRLTLVLLVAALPLAGCMLLVPDNHDGSGRDGDAVRVVDSPEAFPDRNDAAWIREAELDGDRLRLRVQYSGGCETHDFELYGLTAWAKSDPPVGSVHLFHDANGDLCEALPTEDVSFDLRPLTNAWRTHFDHRGEVHIDVFPPGASAPAFRLKTEI